MSRWLPMLAWMGAIFLLSHQPSTSLPNYGVWDLLVKKGAHFFSYTVLAILAFRGTMNWKRPYLSAFLITAIYAISDEFHQQFVAGRHPALMDVMIDCLGALTALYLLYRNANLRDMTQRSLNAYKRR